MSQHLSKEVGSIEEALDIVKPLDPFEWIVREYRGDLLGQGAIWLVIHF